MVYFGSMYFFLVGEKYQLYAELVKSTLHRVSPVRFMAIGRVLDLMTK